PALPSFGPPPGLAASLRRRQEWTRRRKARKLRRTALALTPAVVLPFTAVRTGGSGSGLALDDPPSLTFRLGPTETAPTRTRVAPPPSAATTRSLQGGEESPPAAQ